MNWIIFIVLLVAYLVYDELSFEKQMRAQGQALPQDGADRFGFGTEPEKTGSNS